MKKRSRFAWMLAVELALTVCICIAVVLSNVSVVRNEAKQYLSEIDTAYRDLTNKYISVFKAITVPVKEKIGTNPSFEEMNAWLQAHEKAFRDAIGESVYDGFAMTYKGRYAHSWSYGDYSNYDPNTRPWYQEARRAEGKVTVVAPYISFLGSNYLNSDQIVEMTIAQRYSDEISFDLDLKIVELNLLFQIHPLSYRGVTALLFDRAGFILSTSDKTLYCHNVHQPDESISKSMSQQLISLRDGLNVLHLMTIDEKLNLVYASGDRKGNTYCLIIPFHELFISNFLVVVLITLFLTALEIGFFLRNQRILSEISTWDEKIAEINKASYQQQFYVDLATMKSSLNDVRSAADNDYRIIYQHFYDSLADADSEEEFKSFLAPESLLHSTESKLVSKKFTFNLPYKGSKTRRILEFSLLISKIDGKLTAAVLSNDVTDKERKQHRIMQSIAHRYLAAVLGNTETHRIDVIKMDEGSGLAFDFNLSTPEENESFARRLLKEEYISPFLEMMSFQSIARKLKEHDSYSLTVGLKDGHWHTIKLICGEDYAKSHEFVITIELADEQMRQQETLKEALNRANEAVRAKTEFLSRMSHDIRTPMNGIIGMTRIAQEQENPPKTEDCLKKIDISSVYLLGLINDILDMTKIESGKLQFHPEPYPPEEFHQYLNSVVRPQCEAKEQQFIVIIPEKTPFIPLLDKLRINQVVFNLLSNAIKYTHKGGMIEYRQQQTVANGKMELQVSVIDNGQGMSPEFQKTLFQPFRQEDSVRSLSEVGSPGLGLTIVKKIVDLMGGTIEVQSQKGHGSTFTVRITVGYMSVADYGVAVQLDLDEKARQKLAGKRVLLCEDNEINMEIARALLEEADMSVDISDNGLKGIKMFEDSPIGFYNFILMDLRMPIMDGYEAARSIRLLDRPDAATVSIVAMTADAFEDDIKKCFDYGMNLHIAKPISPSSVYRTLAAQLHEVGGKGKSY